MVGSQWQGPAPLSWSSAATNVEGNLAAVGDEVLYTDNQATLWHYFWDGSQWQGPKSLVTGSGGDNVAGEVIITENPRKIYYKSTGNALWNYWDDGAGSWQGPTSLNPSVSTVDKDVKISSDSERIYFLNQFGRLCQLRSIRLTSNLIKWEYQELGCSVSADDLLFADDFFMTSKPSVQGGPGSFVTLVEEIEYGAISSHVLNLPRSSVLQRDICGMQTILPPPQITPDDYCQYINDEILTNNQLMGNEAAEAEGTILSTSGFEVFPNPSSGEISIRLPQNQGIEEGGRGKIEIYTLTGSLVTSISVNISQKENEIIRLNLDPGMHLIRFIREGSTQANIEKVVIN